MRIVWSLLHSSDAVVGYFWKEGNGIMTLLDLRGKTFMVPAQMTVKEALRILLSGQEMVA